MELLFIIIIIVLIIKYIDAKKQLMSDDIVNDTKRKYTYIQKNFMSDYELKFHDILKELSNEYNIIPQVNLASIIDKKGDYKYRSELFRNIDYGVFDKNYKKCLLLIELNDKTHNELKRKDRDLKVKKICNEAGIPLLSFYTKYPNEKDYVINRIKKELEGKAMIEEKKD